MCGYVVCRWVRVIEGVKGVHGIRYVSGGFCLLYLRFIVLFVCLLDLSVGAMGGRIVHGSCRGGGSAGLEVCLLYFRSMSLTLCSWRCAHGVQYSALMAPPLYVLQCAALGGCLWGFPSVLALWCSHYLGGESFTWGGHCVGSVKCVMYNGVAPPGRLLQCVLVWICGPWLCSLLVDGEKGGGVGGAAFAVHFCLWCAGL